MFPEIFMTIWSAMITYLHKYIYIYVCWWYHMFWLRTVALAASFNRSPDAVGEQHESYEARGLPASSITGGSMAGSLQNNGVDTRKRQRFDNRLTLSILKHPILKHSTSLIQIIQCICKCMCAGANNRWKSTKSWWCDRLASPRWGLLSPVPHLTRCHLAGLSGFQLEMDPWKNQMFNFAFFQLVFVHLK